MTGYYCPRVLEGITMPGAVRLSLDASQGGGSRTVLTMTGPAREHSQEVLTLVTETADDEREVIWCVLMAQRRGLAADRTMGSEAWAGVEVSAVSPSRDRRVCSLQGWCEKSLGRGVHRQFREVCWACSALVPSAVLPAGLLAQVFVQASRSFHLCFSAEAAEDSSPWQRWPWCA